MKARIYAMAWRVLPFVCYMPAGSMLGYLVMQVFRCFK